MAPWATPLAASHLPAVMTCTCGTEDDSDLPRTLYVYVVLFKPTALTAVVFADHRVKLVIAVPIAEVDSV